ncbi:hypothetical protein QAB99_14140 [Staphylococcus aureus]
MKIFFYFVYFFISFFILYSLLNLLFLKEFAIYRSLIATMLFSVFMTLYVFVLKGDKKKK